MARFENYNREKAYWFITYLRLAEAICIDPSISAKNSDFKEQLDKYYQDKIERMEKLYGFTHGKE
jgi:hypothetical protein